VVYFDIRKEELHGYAIHTRTGAPDREITVMIKRRTDLIEEQLNELVSYAEDHGLDGLCVVREPTGGYDEELLSFSRLDGHLEKAYIR